MTTTIPVDIWSDIACPWCFIGKRRFETALASLAEEGITAEVTYHSYELAPDTPVDFSGSEIDFLATHKGMPRAQVEQMLGQVTEVAAAEGLAYDFDALQHRNTVQAHELLHFARESGSDTALLEGLFSAYFEEGADIGDRDELVRIAVAAGLDGEAARAALESGDYLERVRADEEQARRIGVNGVPFYVLDGRYGVSGAQDPAVFADALRQVAAEKTAAP